MMSAHDVAVAALNEVASHQRSKSRVSDHAVPRATNNGTATSIEASTSALKNALSADVRESNASFSFQSSSSNNSQTTLPDATTPPSSDSFSSQSQQSPSQPSQPSQPIVTQQVYSQLANTALLTPTIATNAGQKRTLDGFVKPNGSSSSSSASPPGGPSSGHSRNISSVFSAISSRELVSELRTRLSYAIVKVNKGWEDLPIDEVESRTSQAGSPTSSTSTLQGRRHAIASPRSAIACLQGQPRDSTLYGNVTTAPALQSDTISYTEGQRSRTYESFWREQNQRSSQTPVNLTSSASTHPSLAPPADITSAARYASNPRRSETPRFTKPPTLIGQSTSDLSLNTQHSVGTHTPTPRTPNRNINPVDAMLQTANQKSLQERDAIETLIFMSSPGNSNSLGHNFPPSEQMSQQPSPLRAEFGAPLRDGAMQNVDFTSVPPNVPSEAGSTTPSARKQNHHITRLVRPGDDFYDVMLDGMPDTDSSDDEIEIPITPRRLAASRI